MPEQVVGFFSRFLEYRLPEVFKKKYRALRFDTGELLYQTPDLPVGAKSIVVELENGRGDAAIVASNDSDVPLVDTTVSEDTYKTVRIAAGFRYDDEELEAAAFAESRGQRITNISERRMENAMRAINTKSHLLAAFGDVSYGIQGILNDPNVPVENSSTDLYAVGTTPDQVIAFFTNFYGEIRARTNQMGSPNIILVPEKLYTKKLIASYRSSSSDATALKLILDALAPLGLKAIVPVNELASAELEKYGVHSGGTNKDRIVMYSLGTDSFQRKFTPTRQSEIILDNTGMGRKVYLWKRVSSVFNEYPDEAQYIDFPKAA